MYKYKTSVFIDGFNLYYGSLKNTDLKWLNLESFCDKLLPKNDVTDIYYFTACVKPRSGDDQVHIRQQTYLRALRTLPRIKIIYGSFQTSVKAMPLAYPRKGASRFVEVIKTEEKGSDVNLATWLLIKAYEDAFETAVVVTNDSDLESPILYV
ncbi:MAG: NYN domain-containing protein, partial [Verrucomicrobiota bacterium]